MPTEPFPLSLGTPLQLAHPGAEFPPLPELFLHGKNQRIGNLGQLGQSQIPAGISAEFTGHRQVLTAPPLDFQSWQQNFPAAWNSLELISNWT